LIGFHFQNTVDNWPLAVSALPDYTVIKAIDRGDILRDVKRINPTHITVLRHWYDQGQIFGGSYEDNKQRAQDFLASFLDGTFDREYKDHVDFVEGWNEYNATSHTPAEVAERVLWVKALCDVWNEAYRAKYPNISLCLANTAVGNDIPLEVARLAAQNGHAIGYHPYTAVTNGQIQDNTYYFGRWKLLDQQYVNEGIFVRWLFTEMGPIRYDNGHLAPNDGWLHGGVYGNYQGYEDCTIANLDEIKAWNESHGGRVIGGTLFTTGGGDRWKWFETKQPEMGLLAEAIFSHSPPTEPPPPIEPPIEVNTDDKAREVYNRTYFVIPQDATPERAAGIFQKGFEQKRTVGFSYDDAGMSWGVGDKVAILYDIPIDARENFATWYAFHYPHAQIQFASAFDGLILGNPLGAKPYRVTSQFGDHRVYGAHEGIDLISADNDPHAAIFAAYDGIVDFTKYTTTYGNQIRLRHVREGYTFYTRYTHLKEVPRLPVGAEVFEGEEVGIMGNTGNSTGFHLHFNLEASIGVLAHFGNGASLRVLNPLPYLPPQ